MQPSYMAPMTSAERASWELGAFGVGHPSLTWFGDLDRII